MSGFDIGSKVKKLRQSKKLTLQAVAREIGFSPALISQIENNNVSPPIATLSKIAKFFEVKMGYFFSDEEDDCGYEIVRANQRKLVSKAVTPIGASSGYSCEALSHRKQNKKMEPCLVTLTEKTDDEISCSHDGEKFVFITKGDVELLVEDKHIFLSEGDSIYLNALVKHTLRPKNGKEANLITITSR